MAIPTIVLLASATVTLVGVGPIKGILVQNELWPSTLHVQLTRPVELPVAAAAPASLRAEEQAASRTSVPNRRVAPADVYRVPAGTPLFAVLQTALSSATTQVDDEIRATLRSAVTQDGVELVPAGSVLHGKVVHVEPASPRQRRGHISIACHVVQHAETGSRAPIVTRVLTMEPSPVDPALVGKSAAKRPMNMELPAGYHVTLTLAEPLVVRIPK